MTNGIIGYAGRTELPDNLKSMFRPISMIVPDSGLIAEIILFGEGFSQTRVNRIDIVHCSSLLQSPYSFLLRKYSLYTHWQYSSSPNKTIMILGYVH